MIEVEKRGFRCGLEIHQRLDAKKLFCSCRYDDAKSVREGREFSFQRRFNAVAGETGKVDEAAIFEAEMEREKNYLAREKFACFVETDSEPPHAPNEEAIQIAAKIALMLESRLVDEIHFMRKTVLDGSAVSGFQRTALVALGGRVQTSLGPVGIQSVCLEEESAGIIDGGYCLDRLGIPLVEIATEPEIQGPEHARETAEKIGSILRSTRKVQRGIGTIRQDLNISIQGGARVEIKGVQDLDGIPETVRGEIERQEMILDAAKELKKRGVKKAVWEKRNATRLFEKTNSAVLKAQLKQNGEIWAVKLDKFSGLLGSAKTGKKLGAEFAGRVKRETTLKGIFHTDELPDYGITAEEAEELKEFLEFGKSDAAIILAGQREDVQKGISAIAKRAEDALAVPREVRKAEGGGKSSFLRPMPGAARMYPETDAKPFAIGERIREQLKANLPKSAAEKEREYAKMGLNRELAEQMAKSEDAQIFEDAVAKGADAQRAAVTLLQTKKSLKREGFKIGEMSEEKWAEFFRAVAEGKVSGPAWEELLKLASENPDERIEALAKRGGLLKMSQVELKCELEKIGRETGLDGERLFSEAMKRLRMRAEPEQVKGLILGNRAK